MLIDRIIERDGYVIAKVNFNGIETVTKIIKKADGRYVDQFNHRYDSVELLSREDFIKRVDDFKSLDNRISRGIIAHVWNGQGNRYIDIIYRFNENEPRQYISINGMWRYAEPINSDEYLKRYSA